MPIQILFSFLVTFLVIIIAFSVGIRYVVRMSNDDKNITNANVYVAVNNSIQLSLKLNCATNGTGVNPIKLKIPLNYRKTDYSEIILIVS